MRLKALRLHDIIKLSDYWIKDRIIRVYRFGLSICFFLPGILIAQELPQEIGGIVNAYSKVTNIDTLCDFVEVLNPEHFVSGNKVLLIQMQGVQINETNTSNFGDILDYRNAGNYEYADVLFVLDNRIYFRNHIIHDYNPNNSVQLVYTPEFEDVVIINEITCPAWNGETGGIISIICRGTIELKAGINCAGKGFRGGGLVDFELIECTYVDYAASFESGIGGQKGEGIAQYIFGKDYARGKNANGGGGGNVSNTGAGGGSNAGAGGRGGSEWSGCSIESANAGVGGQMIGYDSGIQKVFMGGGGGGACQDNDVGTEGVPGGGIIILQFERLITNMHTIDASGESQRIDAGIDSGGGGGAGGSVLLSGNFIEGNLRVFLTGGKGGGIVAHQFSISNQWGTGGGGGGGLLRFNNLLTTANITSNLDGGRPGDNPILTAWGATAGLSGRRLDGLIIPTGSSKENLISEKEITFCIDSPLKALSPDCGSLTNWIVPYSDSIIVTEELNLNDLDTALQVIAVCGNIYCPDSIIIFNVQFENVSNTTNIDASICLNEVFEYNGETINTPGIYPYTFTSSQGCDSIIIIHLFVNPTFDEFIVGTICEGGEYIFNGETITLEGLYTAQLQSQYGCDSTVTLQLEMATEIQVNVTASICEGESYAFGGQSVSMAGQYVSEVLNPFGCDSTTTLDLTVNPVYHEFIEAVICIGETYSFNDLPLAVQGIYVDTLQTGSGCDSISRLELLVSSPEPDFGPDRTICPDGDTIFLHPGSFTSYLWGDGMSSPQIAVTRAGTYTVQVIDQFGCRANDSITIQENCDLEYFIPDAFSPDKNGINEIFQVYFNRLPESFELQIFDRWGEKVALLTDPLKGWDGKFKGKDAPTGVYVWVAKIEGKTYSGDLLLYR